MLDGERAPAEHPPRPERPLRVVLATGSRRIAPPCERDQVHGELRRAALFTERFALPAEKLRATDAPEWPPGFLESRGSAAGADLARSFAQGEADNETDNDVSVDEAAEVEVA